jgi:predicted NBD/HSP70 family sugar kinase
MKFADRAARNEEIFRGINKRIEEGADQHGVNAPLPFHCECGRTACLETIELQEATAADRGSCAR